MKKLLSTLIFVVLASYAVQAQSTMVIPSTEPVNDKAPLEYSIQNNEVQTGSAIEFSRNSAEILPSSFHSLRTIKKFLEDKSYITMLRVEGHTAPGDEDAQSLSEKRAMAVCNWLVAEGVDCRRLLAVGFGDTKPITSDHAKMNARIVFANAALRGIPIGGMPVDGGGKVAGEVCK